ncbi:MAG: TIGR01440 family protein [Lachnospiraceae bacterium]|jgi:uncharacterized protein (TIGR01440 family)
MDNDQQISSDFLSQVTAESRTITELLCEQAKLHPGDIFVVGCSSSEILGENIGTHTSMDAAAAAYKGIKEVLDKHGLRIAAQCCEHLNRALIVERETMEAYGLEQVNVIPQPNHAGGAFATVAYQNLKDPAAVESLNQKASAGIDIGGTLIGMHIHPVVVPVRVNPNKIGNAYVICARRRPKYVGGARAVYDQKLM